MPATLTKAERYDRTREALLNTAHKLFVEQGYAGTSTQEIVSGAGVTRGALYYHFQNKKAVFQAVFIRLRQERLRMVREKMRGAKGDLWQRTIEAGSAAFIDSLSDKDAQRIIYVDGPAVLSSKFWYQNTPGLEFVAQGLRRLGVEGVIRPAPYDVLARLVWGALLEAGVYVSHAPDGIKAQHDMLQGLRYLFEGMRAHES